MQRLLDVVVIDGPQVDVGEEAVEPVRYHAFEQRRLVGDQTIQRFGGDPGAAGHALHAGRRIAAVGEFMPGGLVDDLAGLIVGADLRPAPATPVFRCVFDNTLWCIPATGFLPGFAVRILP